MTAARLRAAGVQPVQARQRHVHLLSGAVRPFLLSPERGAATSVRVAADPDLAEVTGRYFVRGRPRRSSKRSYDEAAQRRLWQVSADLTGVDVPAA